jgi:hypothetical protein
VNTESWIALLHFFVRTGVASSQNRHFQKFFYIFFRVQRVTFPQAVVMALHSETVHGFSYDNVKIMAMTTMIRSQIASSVHLAASAQTLAIIGN